MDWYRGYIASMFVFALLVVGYIMVTEGPIHDAAWEQDCLALDRGEAVASGDTDRFDYIRHCPNYTG